jgi:hypothetical protein
LESPQVYALPRALSALAPLIAVQRAYSDQALGEPACVPSETDRIYSSDHDTRRRSSHAGETATR